MSQDILPKSYTTPLYFTVDELQLLKGSPAQSKCEIYLTVHPPQNLSGKVTKSHRTLASCQEYIFCEMKMR